MQELKIEYLSVAKLKPYENNTRKHAKKDVDNIAKSIERYGFADPIGIWGEDNIIVEGHGRLQAAKKLGMTEVPCIRLDHLSEQERREYAIAHNATAELSMWDAEMLKIELPSLSLDGFDFPFLESKEEIEKKLEEKYTVKRDVPQYEITGEKTEVQELVDTSFSDELKEKIKSANIPEDIKDFLLCAANRHNRFNYTKIAEFYAAADKTVQRLMEESALVIIDFNDAIKYGYVKLFGALEALKNDEA